MSITSKFKSLSHHPLRAKLIFHAGSGRLEESPQQLSGILSEMEDHQILPKVYIVCLDSNGVSPALLTYCARVAS